MKTFLGSGIGFSFLLLLSACSPQTNTSSTGGIADTNPPPRLTVELRDGSRVVGDSVAKNFKFQSALLGEIKLNVKDIRSVEGVSSNFFKLATTDGDSLTVAFADSEFSVKTSFGKVDLQVNSVRKFSVAVGGVGGQPPGLVANWGFDSLTGCSLLLPLHGNTIDSSGNGNNFSSSGGVTLNTTYATFDGSSGYLSHAAIPFMAGDFTVSIWVYISGGSGDQKIISNLWDYHDGQGEWSLDYQNGSLSYSIYGNSGWVWLGQSVGSMSQNAWHMLTVTKSGSNFTFYIDGSSSWSSVSSDSFNDSAFSNQLHLACGINTSGIPEQFVTGNLSMAALFTRALSPTEISDAYANQHP